jgi:hypothetical protein
MSLHFLFERKLGGPRPGDETEVAQALEGVFEDQEIVDEELDTLFERCKSAAKKKNRSKQSTGKHWKGSVSAFYDVLRNLKLLPLLPGWKFEIPENGPSGKVRIIAPSPPLTDDPQQA